MDGLPLTTAQLAAWVDALATLHPDVPDAERIDRIRLLEDVKGAIAAAQAREAVALKRSVVAAEAELGVPYGKRGRGVAAQVALARRESPHRGDRLMGLAEALVGELPGTMTALTRGLISEWRATLVCRETACLSEQDRREVDRRLTLGLPMMSDRQVAASARGLGYELDPYSIVNRSASAVADRRVTMRPAPDTMAIVSALLPVAQGVAVFAALTRAADTARVNGDPRTRGQVMADTLASRATGLSEPDQVPIELQLVITDKSLLAGGRTPADLVSYGPLPAGMARYLVASLQPETKLWLRRLYTDPKNGQLVAMESQRRLFPKPLRQFLLARDQLCRTPWCGAPIRHSDHVKPARSGGSTSAANGQGLCERCNQVKESAGWHSTPESDGTVVTTTRSGQRYSSLPPPRVGIAIRVDIRPAHAEAA